MVGGREAAGKAAVTEAGSVVVTVEEEMAVVQEA